MGSGYGCYFMICLFSFFLFTLAQDCIPVFVFDIPGWRWSNDLDDNVILSLCT
jgi:hypothetical protein